MAFGALIKLRVDRSNESEFRKEIQDYVSRASAGIKLASKNTGDVGAEQKALSQQLKETLQLSKQIGTSVAKMPVSKQTSALANEYQALLIKIEQLRSGESERSRQTVTGIFQEVQALRQKAAALRETQAAQQKEGATTQAALTQSLSLRSEINRYVLSNSRAYRTYQTEFDSMLAELNSSKNTPEKVKAIRQSFISLKDTVNQTGQAGKTFKDTLLKGWEKFGGWSIVTKSMMAAYRTIKKIVSAVTELDSAMTELKKVTDLSAQSYNNYLKEAAQTSHQIGATLADTVNATADFARLGYSLSESADLAKAALIYKNVGDGIDDISVASESLISTIKAFGIEASNAMSIVDKFNEVGKFYAETHGNVRGLSLLVAISVKSQKWSRPSKDLVFVK